MTPDPLHNIGVTPTPSTSPISGGEGAPKGMPGEPGTPFSLGEGGKGAGGATLSPMDLSSAQGAARAMQMPTEANLTSQAQTIASNMGNVQERMQALMAQNQGAQFNVATNNLVNTHLNRIADNLSVINNKLGTEQFTPPVQKSNVSNVEYFLNYIAGSQQQMTHVADSLHNPPGGKLTPADLLAVQVKMNGIQMQVEFFSTLVGKATDDIKTVMSIQS